VYAFLSFLTPVPSSKLIFKTRLLTWNQGLMKNTEVFAGVLSDRHDYRLLKQAGRMKVNLDGSWKVYKVAYES
jgi:hypothetical protein